MIRPEVEKLRGTTFSEEELKDVILPILQSKKDFNIILTRI